MKMDYIVQGRSNQEVRNIAMWSRRKFGVYERESVDIVACLTSGSIETIVGRKQLEVQKFEDVEMGDDDAVTYVEASRVVIRCKKSVWNILSSKPKYALGDGAYYRARWTFAHELGHGVLNHNKAPMARGTGVTAFTKAALAIPAFESAEHQANQFALAFLVDIELARESGSAEEVSTRFSISITAARALFGEFAQGRKSKIVSEGFAELMRGLGRALPSNYEGDLCSVCGETTNQSSGGNRSRCLSCQTVSNNLEEGG